MALATSMAQGTRTVFMKNIDEFLQLLKLFIFGQVNKSVSTLTASTFPSFIASINGVLPPASISFFSA